VAKRIVIAGGGAIGVSIAYFLSRRGAEPIVIERHEVAGSASGKSGGFLAMDWCRGTALDRLARRSFALHAELADTLGNPWAIGGSRPSRGWAAENETATWRQAAAMAFRPGLDHRPARLGRKPRPSSRPRGFTTGLMRAAEAQGAELRRGAVVDLMRRSTAWVASCSTAARPSKPTPWSSPWDHGRSWRHVGCRCRRCSATRATA